VSAKAFEEVATCSTPFANTSDCPIAPPFANKKLHFENNRGAIGQSLVLANGVEQTGFREQTFKIL